MSPRVFQATELLGRGRYLEAEALLRAAINEGVRSSTVHAMLALCLRNAGLPDAADVEIKNALSINPDCAYSHYVLSFLSQPKGQGSRRRSLDSPLKHILRALELAPEEVPYLVRLAELRQDSRQWKQSLEPIEAGLRRSPRHAGLAVLRAEALTHLGRRNEARETLLRALAADPEASGAQAGMGWALLRAGEYRRAAEFFDEALRLRSELEWAQHGALECAKHQYRLYRLLAYPNQKLIHRPLLCFALEMGGCVALVLAAFATLFWLDPIIRPRWGGGLVAAIFLPMILLPFALMFGKEPFFSWLVRRHRSAQLSATGPVVREQAFKWVAGLIVAGVTVIFTIFLGRSKSPLMFGLLGLVPGLVSLAVTFFDVPIGKARNWLTVYSFAFLITGPILMVAGRGFILDLDPDPRSAVLLLVPAIFVAIVSARVKQRNNLQRHQQALDASRKKLLSE